MLGGWGATYFGLGAVAECDLSRQDRRVHADAVALGQVGSIGRSHEMARATADRIAVSG